MKVQFWLFSPLSYRKCNPTEMDTVQQHPLPLFSATACYRTFAGHCCPSNGRHWFLWFIYKYSLLSVACNNSLEKKKIFLFMCFFIFIFLHPYFYVFKSYSEHQYNEPVSSYSESFHVTDKILVPFNFWIYLVYWI